MKKSLIKTSCIAIAASLCFLLCGCQASCSKGKVTLGEDISKGTTPVVSEISKQESKEIFKEESKEISKEESFKEDPSKAIKESIEEESSSIDEKSVVEEKSKIEENSEISLLIKEDYFDDMAYPEEISEEEIVFYVEESITEETYIEPVYTDSQLPMVYFPYDFQTMGIINWGGWSWTYYSEIYMPGEGLPIPGRHVDTYGFVCDENDYICVASSVLPKGTVIETPFGKYGKVYDCGCLNYIIDCYVHW